MASSTEQCKNRYGHTPKEVQSHLVMVDFLGHHVMFHALAAPSLVAVARDLQAAGITYKFRIVETYCWRANRNHPKVLSLHSFGIAVDINPDTNPNGGTRHDMPAAVVAIFEKHNFLWGGHFHSTKDWMHFEWHAHGV